MKTIENVFYSKEEDKNRVLNIYLPDIENFPVFVYFHGGGLQSGTHEYEILGKYLTARGMALVSVQYRMYPEAKYPDFIEDAAEAVSWTLNNINQYGRCEKIYVGGSSAGGYISMMLCFDEKWLLNAGVSPDSVSGYVHDAGQPTVHFNVLKEDGVDFRTVVVDERAPLYHIGKAESYPPMLFIVSDDDIPSRYEQTMLVLSTLKHFEYDTGKVKLKEMQGKHHHYYQMVDENGESVFGKIAYEFFSDLR